MEKEIIKIDFNFLKEFCLKNGLYKKCTYGEYEYSCSFGNIEIQYSVNTSKNEYLHIKDISLSKHVYDTVVFSQHYSYKKNKSVTGIKQYKTALKNKYDFTNVNAIYDKVLLNDKLQNKFTEQNKKTGVKKI